MSLPRSIMIAIVIVALLAASEARAGIADSPLPELVAGKTTLHVYSVPGVLRTGGVGTFFSCTSTDTVTMQAGVELFFSAGGAPVNDAVATSLSLAPGATVVFGTGGAVWIGIDSNLGFIGKGSARILATSKKLACTAFVADEGNAPPTSMAHLNIISKVKQKGD